MTKVLQNISEAKQYRASLSGQKIAFVPTMGNLHAGHIELMRIAKQSADKVVASIFVNPTQFGKNEDLSSYPRTFDSDVAKLTDAGVDALLFPSELDIYPNGLDAAPMIFMPHLMQVLCAVSRPTHFQGVATVVSKLFNIISPNIAVFGKKDYQQQVIIKNLVKEYFMDIEVIAAPITREDDGLAMSSRNQYLSEDERAIAPIIYQTLSQIKKDINEKNTAIQLQQGIYILKQKGFVVDYLSLRNKNDLTETIDKNNSVLLVAAKLGKTRLIDNIEL